jgi:hypothetical protein
MGSKGRRSTPPEFQCSMLQQHREELSPQEPGNNMYGVLPVVRSRQSRQVPRYLCTYLEVGIYISRYLRGWYSRAGQAISRVLTRCPPRAVRGATGLLKVAKFPKSSATAPCATFCQPLPMLSPTPKSSALRRVPEKFDRGNSQRRQGNPAWLATASPPSPIDRRASRSLARHRRTAVAGHSATPSHALPRQLAAADHTRTRETRDSAHPARSLLPLLR